MIPERELETADALEKDLVALGVFLVPSRLRLAVEWSLGRRVRCFPCVRFFALEG